MQQQAPGRHEALLRAGDGGNATLMHRELTSTSVRLLREIEPFDCNPDDLHSDSQPERPRVPASAARAAIQMQVATPKARAP